MQGQRWQKECQMEQSPNVTAAPIPMTAQPAIKVLLLHVPQLIIDVSWCRVSLNTIIVLILFTLDDLEDYSQLRRGSPSNYIVYDMAQAIKLVAFFHIEAIKELGELISSCTLSTFR